MPSFWLGTLLSCAGLCLTPLALAAASHRDLRDRVKALEATLGSFRSGVSPGGLDAS